MKEEVVYGDLTFVKYLDGKDIAEKVKEIARDVTKNHEHSSPVFLVILNGAFMFAADLLRHIHFSHEVLFVEAKSYEGIASTGNVAFDESKLHNLKGRNVIIIEDIVDSGKTLSEFVKRLQSIGLNNLDIATLLSKPDARKYEVECGYVGFIIPDLFVVGYGLDYNNMGRSLPDIYQLKPNSTS